MDPFVPFQVMVPVEALRALIALEWTFGQWCLLLSIYLRHRRGMATVEVRHSPIHIVRYTSNQRHLSVGAMDIGHDGTRHTII